MEDTLNTPERIQRGFAGTVDRIRRMDQALGPASTQEFARQLSRLFRHQNPDHHGLAKAWCNKDTRPKACLYISSAAAEFSTGWDSLRIGRVPAAIRSARVATELLAAGALIVLPRHWFESLPSNAKGIKKLREHPNTTIFNLINAQHDKKTGMAYSPVISATEVFGIFLDWVESEHRIDQRVCVGLREYRKNVHHPLAHGTTEVWSQHFLGFDGTQMAPGYSEDRVPIYQECAQSLALTVHQWVAVLDEIAGLKGS